MSTTYVIEKLEEIRGVRERTAKAEQMFNSFRSEMPNGMCNPELWDWDFSPEHVRKYLDYSEGFYSQLQQLCGGKLPENISKAWEEFRRNSEMSLFLLGKSKEEIRAMGTEEFFPWWSDFDGAVKKLFNGCLSDIPLDQITFCPEKIGKGGLATVYVTQCRKYALKLFHPLFRYIYVAEDWPNQTDFYEYIYSNLRGSRGEFSKEPFVPIHSISHYEKHRETFAYISDFAEGINARTLVEKGDVNKEMTGRILLTYAQMLQTLHGENKVFIENNLGAVIVGADKITICDYDFATPVDKLKADFYPRVIASASREQLLRLKPTFSGDLEGLAHMGHHLILGKPFITENKGDTENRHYLDLEMAKKNKRNYPVKFRRKLPGKLREVVAPLIQYPRDDSITASDFVSAVKLDFRI